MADSLPRWLRAFFVLVTVQALVVAVGVVWPSAIPRLMPWDASPLNARFIGALYAMGALSAGLCLLARRYGAARITLIEIGLVTLLLLLITLPRLGEFVPPRPFPWGWLASYLVDPLLAGWLLWQMRGTDPAPAGRGAHAAPLAAYAAGLGLVGLLLLLAPALAGRIWPWELPEVLGQLYSAFFLGMAASAGLAARDPRWSSARIFAIANLFVLLLVLLVSLLHLDRFRPGLASWAWFGFCIGGALAFGLALWRRRGAAAMPATA